MYEKLLALIERHTAALEALVELLRDRLPHTRLNLFTEEDNETVSGNHPEPLLARARRHAERRPSHDPLHDMLSRAELLQCRGMRVIQITFCQIRFTCLVLHRFLVLEHRAHIRGRG